MDSPRGEGDEDELRADRPNIKRHTSNPESHKGHYLQQIVTHSKFKIAGSIIIMPINGTHVD